VIGMGLPQALKIISAAGVRPGAVDTVAGGQEAGIVMATRPAAGIGRPRGSVIALVVTRGPEITE
jgi:beta-lactam-binding protein with PASTA domain